MLDYGSEAPGGRVAPRENQRLRLEIGEAHRVASREPVAVGQDALNNLGNLHLHEGDYERATELFEESLAIGEAGGDLDRRARQLVNLGVAAHGLGDTLRAPRALLPRSHDSAGDRPGRGELNALLGLAACEAASGDAVKAARVLGWTQAAESRLSSGIASEDSFKERTLAILRESLGAHRLEAELGAGAALSHDDAVSLALGPT